MPAPRSQMPKGWATSLFHLTCHNLHLGIARGVAIHHLQKPAKSIAASAEKRFPPPAQDYDRAVLQLRKTIISAITTASSPEYSHASPPFPDAKGLGNLIISFDWSQFTFLGITRDVELQHARRPAESIAALAEKRFILPRAGLLPC